MRLSPFYTILRILAIELQSITAVLCFSRVFCPPPLPQYVSIGFTIYHEFCLVFHLDYVLSLSSQFVSSLSFMNTSTCPVP